MLLRSVFVNVLKYAMEKGGHEKITSDPRLRLKVNHAQLRTEQDITFDPEQFETDYQVETICLFCAIYIYAYKPAIRSD